MTSSKSKLKTLLQLQLPEEYKLENLERRSFTATFDRLDLVIEFRGGHEHIGATVKGFLDAIPLHDHVVRQIEDQMKVIDEVKRIYRKKNRLFINLDNAWNVMFTNPIDFHEYIELIPKMKNIEERLKMIDDAKVKAKLITQYERFRLLHPTCSRQKIIYETYQVARKEKDDAMAVYLENEKILVNLREEEKTLAGNVSDDHILADETNKSLMGLFPNIQPGYILVTINGHHVEHMPYEDVIKQIQRSKSPHKTEFKRYDYRYNLFEQHWYTLQQLRDMGVCVEDPVLRRLAFISAASKGDYDTVYDLLEQGEDPNTTDLTGNSALVASCVNQHENIIELLAKAGCQINKMDKNGMTPLLYVTNRGYTDIARLLMDLGANRHCVDNHGRDCLYYAIMSGNVLLVKMFLTMDKINKAEKLWGYTPLHLAANQGHTDIVDFLVTSGCSIYALDKKGKTAEQVALEVGYPNIAKRLEEERIYAPAQCIFYDTTLSFQLWIGDMTALDPNWCNDLDFSCLICFHMDAVLPMHCNWLLGKDMKGKGGGKSNGFGIPSKAAAANTAGAGAGRNKKLTFEEDGASSVGSSTRLSRKSQQQMVPYQQQPQQHSTDFLQFLEESKHSTIPFFHQQLDFDDIEMNADDNWEYILGFMPMLMDIIAPYHNVYNQIYQTTLSTKSYVSMLTVRHAEEAEEEERHRQAAMEEDAQSILSWNTYEDDYLGSVGVSSSQKLKNTSSSGAGTVKLPAITNHNQSGTTAPSSHVHTIQKLPPPPSLMTTNQSQGGSGSNGNGNVGKTRKMCKILLCDDTGNCISPALAMAYLLLKVQQRIADSMKVFTEARPRMEVGSKTLTGLHKLQQQYDERLLKRINQRMRGTVVTSIAF